MWLSRPPRGQRMRKGKIQPPPSNSTPSEPRQNGTNGELVDVELFAGAGGMGVGLRAAGFTPCRFYEKDETCCETLKQNSQCEAPTLLGSVHPGKAEDVEWSPFGGKVRLLAAGAPCQPFSIGGKHEAHNDGRNLFPELLRAIKITKPAAVIIENVRGLARESFRPYFDYVLRQIKFASHPRRERESWRTHNNRLKTLELSAHDSPEYHAEFRVLDAADFGVPQNRSRIFIVATRSDMPTYTFPAKTHSRDALVVALKGKDYWNRHGVPKQTMELPKVDMAMAEATLPWLTVRDGLHGLPEPSFSEDEAEANHWLIPGARRYARHTGSRLDWPGKTVKAGVHGVPGGENTIVTEDKTFRYFTLRETARLQTFPDEHIFLGTRTKVTRQIGNAVPCALATAIARPLFTAVEAALAQNENRKRRAHDREGDRSQTPRSRRRS